MPKKPQQLAKLSRPRLYDALPRERLFALLDQKRRHPAVWIAAPPGAGKSTLVAGYVEHRELPCLWCQIDNGDSDPATFFYYLGLAEKSRPGRPSRTQALPLLTAEYLSELPSFARRYFRQLFIRLGTPAIVVFDNFQELSADSAVHKVLAAAIEEVPEGSNIAILSRLEPEQDYLRNAANRSLARIDWQQLKFTPSEAETILSTQLNLDSAAARKLHEHCDGWAAGLRLLAEWLHRGGSIDEVGKPDSLQDIFGYFAGELFGDASATDQRSLLHLSFLPRIPASVAERMAGSALASRLLEALYRAHLFVDRRSASEPVYQFHALLRAFLQHRATEIFDATEIRHATLAAARILEEFRYTEDAISLYLRAGEFEAVRTLVLLEAKQLIAQGRWQVVVDWITSLPDEMLSQHQWLKYWLGTARMAIDPGSARETLEQAFELASNAGDETCQMETSAGIIRTYMLQYTHFRPLDRWIAVLETKIIQRQAFPDSEAELRVLGAFLVALAYRQPGHVQLPKIVERVFELIQSDLDVNLRLVSAGCLSAYGTNTGPLAVAQRVLPILLKMLGRSDIGAFNAAWSWFSISWLHCICRNEREGRNAVAEVERIAEEEGLPYVRKFSAIIGAWIELFARNLDAAQIWLSRFEKIMSPYHLYDVATLHGTRGFLYGLRGQADLAYADGLKAIEIFDEAGSTMHQITYRITLVLPLVQKGMFSEAKDVIADMHRIGEGSSTPWWMPALLAVEAYTALQEGDRRTGLLALNKAFEYGRVHGDDYGFATLLQHLMPQLCAEALSAGIDVEYTRNLIRRHRWRPPVPTIEDWPWRVRIYSLGKFRIEVDDEPLSFARKKAPKKVLALLKAIIAFGAKAVPTHRLMDALWPEESGEAAQEALAISLHRLRKLLVHSDVVKLSDSSITIDADQCWVDVWSLDRRITQNENMNKRKSGQTESILRLYAGPFLPEDVDSPWALSMRERIRYKFLRYISEAGRLHEDAGNLEDAILLYQRGIEADDLAETLYQGLMRCYRELGRTADALSAYRRVRQTLSVTLGAKPSPETEALARSITSQ